MYVRLEFKEKNVLQMGPGDLMLTDMSVSMVIDALSVNQNTYQTRWDRQKWENEHKILFDRFRQSSLSVLPSTCKPTWLACRSGGNMNVALLISKLNFYWAADAKRYMRGLVPNTLVNDDEYDILGKIGDFHTVLDAGTADLAIIQTLTGWTTRAASALLKEAGGHSASAKFEHLKLAPWISVHGDVVASSEQLVHECMMRTAFEKPHAVILTRMLGRCIHIDPPSWPIGGFVLDKKNGTVTGRLDRP